MASSLFFCEICIDSSNRSLIEKLEKFSEEYSKQVYLIDAPLGKNDNRYDYNQAAVLLIPKHKICFINFNELKIIEFEEYCDDFIDDIGYLADTFEYRNEIGRPRVWKNKLIARINSNIIADNSIENMLCSIEVDNPNDIRVIDFLISLLIGSIIDIKRIGGDLPKNVLDQVKKKIVLFDGDQSRFIYSELEKKRVVIQGLAGTGKTELLLHKLRDLYVNKKDSKIVFTCYNNILAKSMEKRVPKFFNFMRVNEQIEWDKRLWVMPSWGSKAYPDSGVYSYVCHAYGIPFRPYSFSYTFDKVCQEAIEFIEAKGDIVPCFDYILVDESQDFAEPFFRLCELVTKEVVYVAGDIFQDIYDRCIGSSVNSDFLLNKCYRTDPKTLMFAHAVGMGLYEMPVIRWLDDEEWKACGYNFSRSEGNFKLSRVPLRRFEDLNMEDIESIKVIEANNNIPERVYSIIDEIQNKHSTVLPGDIAIVFLEGKKSDNYKLADILSASIKKNYKWETVKGYEIKDYSENAVFISNRNNIKGLEFPFVICIVNDKITENIYSRNTLYMLLTRSFITSYLIINNDDIVDNTDFISTYIDAARDIQESSCIFIREPSEDEKKAQNQKISIVSSMGNRSLKELVYDVLLQHPELTKASRERILNDVIDLCTQKGGNMTNSEIINSTSKLADTYGELQ